ncbi:sulfite exporter TauE/SafE family protein [Thiotrichales bacterium 19S3-7]|nr:sulfite exporter TauE/SafE family protein [Thiotrichales bacterium 19S3-7]MCF6801535.1 sulfite exporter TauE/SafE family protein [Thiotrichales bacterium 19S3-11]
MFFVILILAGIFIGLLTGLFGIGGAIVIVPLVSFLLAAKHIGAYAALHLAIGTSVMTATITNIPALIQHHKLKNIHWPLFLRYLLLGGALGAVVGAILAGLVPTTVLKIFFSVFILLIAFIMIYKAIKPSLEDQTTNKISGISHSVISFLIALISGLVGVGGVSVMTAFLNRHSKIHHAIGTSALFGLPVTFVAAITYLIVGFNNPNLPSFSTGYIYWPAVISFAVTAMLFAPIGTKIAARLSQRKLKGAFGILLAVASIASLVYS